MVLLGATCTHVPPNYVWTERARIAVKTSGTQVTVDHALGDRAFTNVTTVYDVGPPLRIRSAKQHGSCCGATETASVVQNADGSLDIETEWCCGLGDTRDVIRESRPHFAQGKYTVVVESAAIVPWLYGEQHVRDYFMLSFFPTIDLALYRVEDAGSMTRPNGVPATDRALRVSNDDPVSRTMPSYLWYDPCTYAIDAIESAR